MSWGRFSCESRPTKRTVGAAPAAASAEGATSSNRARSIPQLIASTGWSKPFSVSRSLASWVGTVMWSARWKRLRRSHQATRAAASSTRRGARTYGRTLSGMKWFVATTGMPRRCACVIA